MPKESRLGSEPVLDVDKAREGQDDGGASASEPAELACPMCGKYTTVMPLYKFRNIRLHDSFQVVDLTDWFYCSCETLFQPESYLDNTYYDEAYHRRYDGAGAQVARQAAFFLPTVEPHVQGNILLDIGDSQPHLCLCAAAMGWLPSQIDINPAVMNSRFSPIHGNFEDYDFGERRYDCLWAAHVFEHFLRPKDALKKCLDLLNPNGCLIVGSPDIYYLMCRFKWGHLHRKEHHIMWSLQSFQQLGESIGFETVYTGRNKQPKIFPTWYEFYWIGKKPGGKVVLPNGRFH